MLLQNRKLRFSPPRFLFLYAIVKASGEGLKNLMRATLSFFCCSLALCLLNPVLSTFMSFLTRSLNIRQVLFGLKTNFSRFFVIEIGHTDFATTGTVPSRSIVSWAKWFGGPPKDRADVKIFIPIVLFGLRTDFSLHD